MAVKANINTDIKPIAGILKKKLKYTIINGRNKRAIVIFIPPYDINKAISITAANSINNTRGFLSINEPEYCLYLFNINKIFINIKLIILGIKK